tara:strand:+ start:457 stop:699 length:243 start_codon:yes stop_codon:yes gene_type:complete
MSHQYWVDQQQVTTTTGIGCVDTAGVEQATYDGATIVPVIVTSAEVANLLAAYDETDPNSPDESTARALARLILNALKAV